MLSLISAALGFIGKIFGIVSNTEIAKVNADAAVDTASIVGTAAVEQRWWFVSAMIPMFALPMAIYTAKIVLIDKIIAPIYHWKGAWATTQPLTGTVGVVYTTVVIGLFLHAISR